MSNSLWPHRRQPTRLPRPWDSPGKNTGVGCHFLLQCMKVKGESEVAQSCLTLSDPLDVIPKLKHSTLVTPFFCEERGYKWSRKGLTFDSLRYMHLACVDTLDTILYVLKCDHGCISGLYWPCRAEPFPQLFLNLIFLDSLGYSISVFQKSLYI